MSEQLSADVVVIGSGICGSLVAQRLAKQGISVIILESGPRIDRGTLTENFRNSPRKRLYVAVSLLGLVAASGIQTGRQ